jgi:hypothetical protein
MECKRPRQLAATNQQLEQPRQSREIALATALKGEGYPFAPSVHLLEDGGEGSFGATRSVFFPEAYPSGYCYITVEWRAIVWKSIVLLETQVNHRE